MTEDECFAAVREIRNAGHLVAWITADALEGVSERRKEIIEDTLVEYGAELLTSGFASDHDSTNENEGKL